MTQYYVHDEMKTENSLEIQKSTKNFLEYQINLIQTPLVCVKLKFNDWSLSAVALELGHAG